MDAPVLRQLIIACFSTFSSLAEYIAIFFGETAVFRTVFDVFAIPINSLPFAPFPPINPEIAPIPIGLSRGRLA